MIFFEIFSAIYLQNKNKGNIFANDNHRIGKSA